MAEKLPFEIRLANIIGRYEALFNEHPPTFGYEEAELYSLLVNCVKNKVELPRIDQKIRDIIDDDDAVILT